MVPRWYVGLCVLFAGSLVGAATYLQFADAGPGWRLVVALAAGFVWRDVLLFFQWHDAVVEVRGEDPEEVDLFGGNR